MRKTVFLKCLSLGILLFLFTSAYGLDLEYKDYEVQKGDTLWDIAEAELTDYFLWPNIWKENPEITNPDLIYPAQHIRIPIYLLQRQVRLDAPDGEPTEVARTVPEVIAPEEPEAMIPEELPREKEYLFDRNLVMISGYISPVIPSIGTIIETPTGRTMVGKGDAVYINVAGDTAAGRTFYTFRSYGKVRHPSGERMGYLIEITGIAEITGEEAGHTKAVIRESFVDINVKDMLQEYFEIEPPLKEKSPRMPDINGFIVTTKELRELNATGDIVYLDKGSEDGVLKGDVFNIVSGTHPKIHKGKMVVLFTKERTATAIITKSLNVVERGDSF